MKLVTPSVQNLATHSELLNVQELLRTTKTSSLPWFLANGVEYDDAKIFAEYIDDGGFESKQEAKESITDVFDLDLFSANDVKVLDLVLDKFFN